MLSQPEITKIQSHPDQSVLLHTDWHTLRSFYIRNWEKNRPPNMQRIHDISQTILTQGYTDGLLYVFRISDTEYVCYDGIHRLEALRSLPELSNVSVLLHYMDIYNEEWVERKFKQINKCIPVPELYTESQCRLERMELIQSTVEYVFQKYPKIFTLSVHPRVPNQSRDILTDQLSDIVSELNITDKQNFHSLLDRWNAYMRHSVETVHSIHLGVKQLEKCRKTNCFMFVSKDWVKLFCTSVFLGNL